MLEGTRAAAPVPLSPLAALIVALRIDSLDEAEHFVQNRDDTVAMLRECSGYSGMPFGFAGILNTWRRSY